MKEKLEAKIEEVLNLILEKDAEDITAVEYGILDAKLKDLYLREEQKESNKRMLETMATIVARA